MTLGIIFIHQVFFHQPHPHTRKRRPFISVQPSLIAPMSAVHQHGVQQDLTWRIGRVLAARNGILGVLRETLVDTAGLHDATIEPIAPDMETVFGFLADVGHGEPT